MRMLTPVFIAGAVIGAGWCYYFAPYYIDEWKMKDVAGSAAATWAAFNEDKAHLELKHQMQHRQIPEYLTPEDCTFYEAPSKAKVVDCIWAVDVYLPLGLTPRRLTFQVTQSADRDGLIDM